MRRVVVATEVLSQQTAKAMVLCCALSLRLIAHRYGS